MKRALINLAIIAALLVSPILPQNSAAFQTTQATQTQASIVYADETDDLAKQLEDTTSDALDDLDVSDLEKILDNTQQAARLFGGKSFLEKLASIINGDFADDSTSIWEALINLIFDNILSFLPIIATVIAVSILGGMIQNLKPNFSGKSIGSVVHFVTYGVVVILIFTVITRMITVTTGTIGSIKAQMDAVFPILLTMLSAVGGSVSVSVYQPAMALLASLIINIFTIFLMPLFLISVVLSLVSNLSNNVKLDKFISFINSLFKWVIGLVFTIFIGFASIQGITAGSIDGLSIKTAKFAIKSYVPIVGSYISDGFYIILASSSLIKNAVGACGLLLLVGTILAPIMQLVIFMLALKLMAGIIEPLGDGKIASFVSTLSKSMTMLISMIVAVSFMYVILTGLVMCSANII